MNIRNKTWFDLLTHPASLALPITVAVIVLLPDIFEKYKLELVRSEPANKANSIEEFIDLDGDGYGERMILFTNEVGIAAFKIMTSDDLNVDQWNFTGRYPQSNTNYYCGDMDGDGNREVYLFTLRSDSLFMQGVAPFERKSHFLIDRFITKISRQRDTVHLLVEHGQFSDLDGDGKDEFVFVVEARYSLQPRAVFIYHRTGDSLLQSQSVGANFGAMVIDDTDGDGEKEIMCSCNTLGNIPDSMGIPYDDYSAYIMGFDTYLHPLFPPLEYEVYPSFSRIESFEYPGGKAYAYLFRNMSHNDTVSEIGLINGKGEILVRKQFSKNDAELGGLDLMKIGPGNGKQERLVMMGMERLVFLDAKLNAVDRLTLRDADKLIAAADLNGDGREELVFSRGHSWITILQQDFTFPMKIETHYDIFQEGPLCISIREKGEEPPELFVKSNNKAYFYAFNSNPLYIFKYPLWFGIFLAVAAIIASIQYLQRLRMQRILELEDSLNALQLKNIKNQVDPHFTLNAINTISGMAIKGEKDKLARFSSEYAGLMRKMLNQSDRIQTTLQEELEFNILYLELQRTRFDESFEFRIEVEDAVDRELLLPRTLLHTYVENAVKYGVRLVETGGLIVIRARKEKRSVVLEVEDNGPGRKMSARYGAKDGSGKGLEIIGSILALYKKLYAIEISTEINDIQTPEGKVAGTRVRIVVPEN